MIPHIASFESTELEFAWHDTVLSLEGYELTFGQCIVQNETDSQEWLNESVKVMNIIRMLIAISLLWLEVMHPMGSL